MGIANEATGVILKERGTIKNKGGFTGLYPTDTIPSNNFSPLFHSGTVGDPNCEAMTSYRVEKDGMDMGVVWFYWNGGGHVERDLRYMGLHPIEQEPKNNNV